MNRKYWLKLKPERRLSPDRGHYRNLSQEVVVKMIKENGVRNVLKILRDDKTPDGQKNEHVSGKTVLEIWKACEKHQV
jgi:hypothetical protein